MHKNCKIMIQVEFRAIIPLYFIPRLLMTHRVTVYDMFLCTYTLKNILTRVALKTVKFHPKFSIVDKRRGLCRRGFLSLDRREATGRTVVVAILPCGGRAGYRPAINNETLAGPNCSSLHQGGWSARQAGLDSRSSSRDDCDTNDRRGLCYTRYEQETQRQQYSEHSNTRLHNTAPALYPARDLLHWAADNTDNVYDRQPHTS